MTGKEFQAEIPVLYEQIKKDVFEREWIEWLVAGIIK